MSLKPQEQPESLTPRQLQLLRTIKVFQDKLGYSPTIGELADRLSISRATVFGHIEQLRRKGLVSHQPNRTRSLVPSTKARRLLNRLGRHRQASAKKTTNEIPLVGVVAAGVPIEAIENRDCLSIDSCFGAAGDIFALEVKGDSMVGDGIKEGDYVICKHGDGAANGQLVVALVDNEDATLKRFYKEKHQARLQPANDDYEPIYSDNCKIQAVVIGLMRRL